MFSGQLHRKGGRFRWDPKKVALWLSTQQQGDKFIKGNKLREELIGKFVFNATLLDYLLANPQLIPKEWRGKYVFFWGTVYRNHNRDGDLYVRYLYWYCGRWGWGHGWLGEKWDGSSPAAVPYKLPINLVP